MKPIPRSRRMSLQSSHLGGPFYCSIARVDSSGRSSVARKSANAFTRRSRPWTRSYDRPMICVSLRMVSVAMALCSLSYAMNSCTMANQDAPRRLSNKVCMSGNWLRVLGTAECSQVDQRIRHQLHAIVPLLDALKSEQQPLELVFPRKRPLDTHT